MCVCVCVCVCVCAHVCVCVRACVHKYINYMHPYNTYKIIYKYTIYIYIYIHQTKLYFWYESQWHGPGAKSVKLESLI